MVISALVVLLIAVATVVIIIAAIVHKRKHSAKHNTSEDSPDHYYDMITSPAMSGPRAEPASPEKDRDQAMKEAASQEQDSDAVKYDDVTSIQKTIENRKELPPTPTEIKLGINEAYGSFKPVQDSETAL